MYKYVILLLLTGCAADHQGFIWEDRTTATQAYENGQPIWVISCELRLAECHKKASDVCLNGYEILEEKESGYGPGRTKHVRVTMQLKASCR